MPSEGGPDGFPISKANRTPPSICDLILRQLKLFQELTQRVEELEVKLGANSKNANRPPSIESPY